MINRMNEFFIAGLEGKLESNVPISEEALVAFISGATLLKHEGFREESEVRIVAMPGTQETVDVVKAEHPEFNPPPLKDILSRDSKRGTLKYISLFDGFDEPLPIKRVIVGHGWDEDRPF
jgi:hypothetical protein